MTLISRRPENPKIMGQVWTIENWVYRLRWRMIKREFGDIYPLIRIPKAYGSRFLQVKNENQMVSGGWLAPEANLTPPPHHPRGLFDLAIFGGRPGWVRPLGRVGGLPPGKNHPKNS